MQLISRKWILGVMIFSILGCALNASAQRAMSRADLDRIGKRIWENECAGSVEGLTSWNSGEDFASLGIGHFIWYPTGTSGPFDESFPKLINYLQQSGVKLPRWLVTARGCPWPDRTAFQKDHGSAQQKELRDLLSRTVAEQTQFIMQRLAAATPQIQSAAGNNGKRVATNLQLLSQSTAGNFAMIDYVNFKGEGLKAEERYNGQGWGLLQVLTEMEAADARSAPKAFADASQRVLTRRVQNSPPARGEKKWLDGWKNRCRSYSGN